MIVRSARLTDLAAVLRLRQHARFRFQSGGSEDIDRMIHLGTVGLGFEHDRLWGMAALQLEARPSTLPVTAPDRAYVRHVALIQGRSPRVDGARLIVQALDTLAYHVRPIEVVAYCSESWLRAPLREAGFTEIERVQFMRLPALQRRTLPAVVSRDDVWLVALEPGDLAALARLDAAAFPPRWHFSESDLLPLIMAGHVYGAVRDISSLQRDNHGRYAASVPPAATVESVAPESTRLVGYSAMSVQPDSGALLERIAVAPDLRRHGIGRMLLVDVLQRARAAGAQFVTLNTQNHNHQAHELYQATGFRWTGYNVPIFTKLLTPTL